jgi:hypothetical protein
MCTHLHFGLNLMMWKKLLGWARKRTLSTPLSPRSCLSGWWTRIWKRRPISGTRRKQPRSKLQGRPNRMEGTVETAEAHDSSLAAAVDSYHFLEELFPRAGTPQLQTAQPLKRPMLEIKLDRVRVRNTSDRKQNISEFESEIPPTENKISQGWSRNTSDRNKICLHFCLVIVACFLV